MDIFKLTAELNESGTAFMLATVVKSAGSSPAKTGFRMVVESGGSNTGTIGGGAVEKMIIDEAAAVLAAEKIPPKAETREINLGSLGMECGGRIEVLIEYFGGKKNFVLFGGGHVGQALAPILEILGYRLTVFDNRALIRPLIIKSGRSVITAEYGDISAVEETLCKAGGCFIATHGHEHDQQVLTQVLSIAPGLPYIGMIGSRKKVNVILDNIAAAGISIPENLYSPVGLKIGGDSAAEIAVSVAAEIVSVNNRSTAVHMRG